MLPVPSTKAERLVFQIPESGWLQAILEKLLFGLSSDQIRPMVENWTWHTPCQTSELFMDMLSTHSFLCWLRWTKSYQLIAKCNGNIAQLFYDSNLLLCRKPALYRQLNSSETPVWEPRSLITWRHVLFLFFFFNLFLNWRMTLFTLAKGMSAILRWPSASDGSILDNFTDTFF